MTKFSLKPKVRTNLVESTACYFCSQLKKCRPKQLDDGSWCWGCDSFRVPGTLL